MGSGFALDVVKTFQQNRLLKSLGRARYNEMKVAVSNIKSKYHKFHDRNTLSEIELIQYKRKIKSKLIKDRQIAFFKSLVITIVIIGIIIYVIKFLYNLFNSSF
jgi:hypothetical protein